MKYIVVTILICVVLLPGCSQISLVVNDPYDYPDDRIYNASFDDTWSALIKAIEWYPIVTIEKDSGILLTDWVDDYSPNQFWIRKPFGDPDIQYGIGVKVTEIDASGLIVASIFEGGPADMAGIQVGDYFMAVDGFELRTNEDFSSGVNSKGSKNLTIKRKGTGDLVELSIEPIMLHEIFSRVFVKYRFNIRVSSIDNSHTEVKVINHEKAKNILTDYSYYFVSSARIREKTILDRIEDELMEISVQ